MADEQPVWRVLVCRCASAKTIDETAVESLLRLLSGRPEVETVAVDDLCGLAAGDSQGLADLIDARTALVVACRARAVRWLLRFAGIGPGPGEPAAVGIRHLTPAEAVSLAVRALDSLQPPPPASPPPSRAAAPPVSRLPDQPPSGPESWEPWYPAIDYDRCTACGKCLDFCPFGVYVRDEGRAVRVAHPRHCKLNCPACARICPQLAIVFPKHHQRPIDGDDVRQADLDARPDQALCERLKHTSIHELLARRGGMPPGARPDSGAPS